MNISTGSSLDAACMGEKSSWFWLIDECEYTFLRSGRLPNEKLYLFVRSACQCQRCNEERLISYVVVDVVLPDYGLLKLRLKFCCKYLIRVE